MLAEASPRLRKRSYVKTSRRRLVRLDGLRPYDSANPAAPYALSPRSFRELVEYAHFVDVVGPIVDALPPAGVAPGGGGGGMADALAAALQKRKAKVRDSGKFCPFQLPLFP